MPIYTESKGIAANWNPAARHEYLVSLAGCCPAIAAPGSLDPLPIGRTLVALTASVGPA